MKNRRYAMGVAVLGFLLTGCVGVPADRGASAARELAESRSAVAGAVALNSSATSGEVERLLAAPLGVDDAVRLALSHHPRMRQLYAQLGFAQGEIYDATRLSNPSLGILRLSADAGEGAETTWSIAQSFTELLFIGYRARMGRDMGLYAQQEVAHAVLAFEAEVREAFYAYVGAQLTARMRGAVANTMRLSAELAARFHEAGNISALRLSREQAAASEAFIEEHRVRVAAIAARSRLLTLLGLEMDDERVRIIETLDLPSALATDITTLTQLASQQRLDLAALRTEIDMREREFVHVRRWRWLGRLALRAEYEREPDGESRRGPGAALDLPVFNSGRGSLLRAEAHREDAAATLAHLELEMANDIAALHATVEAARLAVEEYTTRLLPLRERIVDFSQREQNFMLIGTFELLTARREEFDTYENYINAVRDYWIERSRLAHAAGGALPDDSAIRQPFSLPPISGSDVGADPHAGHGGAR